MASISLFHVLGGFHLLGGHAWVTAATTTNSTGNVSLGSVFLRLLVSLGVVLGVIWILSQYVRRRGMPGVRGVSGILRQPGSRTRGPGPGPAIEVLSRQPLGKGIALVTVRVGVKLLLLGVTSQRVTTLGEIDPESLDPIHDAGDLSTEPVPLDWGGRPGGFPVGPQRPPGGSSPGGPGTGRPLSRLEQLREITTRRS